MNYEKKVLVIASTSDIAKAIIDKIDKNTYKIVTASRGNESDFTVDLVDDNSVKDFIVNVSNSNFDWIIYCAGHITSEENVDKFNEDYNEISKKINYSSVVEIFVNLKENVIAGGGFICISSTAGIWGNADFPIYSNWKGALNIFSITYNKLLSKSNKYIFAICPGPTSTKMRMDLFGHTNECQPASAVADKVKLVIEQPQIFNNESILIIRDGKLLKLEQNLVPI